MINTKKILFRILTVVIALSMIAVCPVYSQAETGRTDHISHEFESVSPSARFGSSTTGLNISYTRGNWRGVRGGDSVNGVSVEIKDCDWRWWNITYTDEEMGFEFDVNINDNFNVVMRFCICTQDAATTTEGLTGCAVMLAKAGGKAVVRSRSGATLKELENGKHHIELIFKKASDVYSVSVDGECVASDCKYVSPVSTINGLRIQCDSSNDGTVIIDNIKGYTIGFKAPQKNSYQEKGALPVVNLPKMPEKILHAYINECEIGDPVKDDDGVLYLPMENVFAALNIASDAGALGITSEVRENGVIGFAYGENKCAIAEGEKYVFNENTGEWYSLASEVKNIDGRTYIPVSLLSVLFEAKVWYAENLNVLLITTGKYRDDDILRMYNAALFMNGEPYYEISFNKFDLYMQVAGDSTMNGGRNPNGQYPNDSVCISAAETALKTLHDNGFKSIRVFYGRINPDKNQSEIDRYWKISDFVMDLCDKYDIKIVPSFDLYHSEFLEGEYVNGVWATKNEFVFDLMTNKDSKSRENMNQFIKAFCDRYKDRKTILMYEIGNEGNLSADVGSGTGVAFSLMQYGAFYADCADQFHECDPSRLVTSGDSMLRSAQWHLFMGTMNGSGMNWTVDTTQERLKALWLLNEKLDVISIHGYSVGYESDDGCSWYADGGSKLCTFPYHIQTANRLGKALYNGESAGRIGISENAAIDTAEAAEGRKNYLQSIIDSGVQLTHWWTFNSDRVGFPDDKTSGFETSLEDTPLIFDEIVKANIALKEKYIVNGADKQNLKAESVSYDGVLLRGEGKKPGSFNLLYPIIAAGAVLIGGGIAVMTMKKKRNK